MAEAAEPGSVLFRRACKALQVAAPMQGLRVIKLHPDDWQKLKDECGSLPAQTDPSKGEFWMSPGSWLLQVPIQTDPQLMPNEVVVEQIVRKYVD